MSPSNFGTPNAVTLVLDLYIADVHLVAGERTDTLVDVRPSDPGRASDVKAAENTRVEYDDATGTLTVTSKRPRNVFANISNTRTESIVVDVRLPADSEVRGESKAGDLTAEGLLGSVKFKAGFGDIRLAETGPLDLKSGLGEIAVDGASGPVEVHTGTGEIRLGAIDGSLKSGNSNGGTSVGIVTGEAALKASNGFITVERALGNITAHSSNGRVAVGEVVHGKVSVTSSNGAVEVGVRDGSAAFLELKTSAGRVHNALEASDAPDASDPVDKVEVRAQTKVGDVTVRRVPALEEQA